MPKFDPSIEQDAKLLERIDAEYCQLKWLHMGKYQISSFLDIGANVGQDTFAARRFFAPSVPIYSFEPHTKSFELLAARCLPEDNIHCFNTGIGNSNGKADFYRCLSSETSQASSFLPFSSGYKEEYPQWSESTLEIKTMRRLDDFLEENGIDIGPSAMLHIDTEGYEHHVLEGAPRTLLKTKAITLEITFGLFENSATFEKLFDILRATHEFAGCISPLIVGSKGQSILQDALFLRRAKTT